jgi:hypothetical protein
MSSRFYGKKYFVRQYSSLSTKKALVKVGLGDTCFKTAGLTLLNCVFISFYDKFDK